MLTSRSRLTAKACLFTTATGLFFSAASPVFPQNQDASSASRSEIVEQLEEQYRRDGRQIPAVFAQQADSARVQNLNYSETTRRGGIQQTAAAKPAADKPNFFQKMIGRGKKAPAKPASQSKPAAQAQQQTQAAQPTQQAQPAQPAQQQPQYQQPVAQQPIVQQPIVQQPQYQQPIVQPQIQPQYQQPQIQYQQPVQPVYIPQPQIQIQPQPIIQYQLPVQQPQYVQQQVQVPVQPQYVAPQYQPQVIVQPQIQQPQIQIQQPQIQIQQPAANNANLADLDSEPPRKMKKRERQRWQQQQQALRQQQQQQQQLQQQQLQQQQLQHQQAAEAQRLQMLQQQLLQPQAVLQGAPQQQQQQQAPAQQAPPQQAEGERQPPQINLNGPVPLLSDSDESESQPQRTASNSPPTLTPTPNTPAVATPTGARPAPAAPTAVATPAPVQAPAAPARQRPAVDRNKPFDPTAELDGGSDDSIKPAPGKVSNDSGANSSSQGSREADNDSPFSGLKLAPDEAEQRVSRALGGPTDDSGEQSTQPDLTKAPPTPDSAEGGGLNPRRGAASVNGKSVPGIKVYCLVTLRKERQYVAGQSQFQTEYQSRIYSFASEAALDEFERHPDRYAPVQNGIDIIAANSGSENVPGSLDHAVWFKGRLYLFSTPENKATFKASPKRFAQ